MKLIAENPVRVPIRKLIEALHDTSGRMIEPEKRRLYAQFVRGVAPEWAREVALTRFAFETRQEGVDPGSWVAYLDTEDEQHGWTDEERRVIEARLEEVAPLYTYVLVERPKLPAPWPSYDKVVVAGRRTIAHVAEKIVERVTEDGYNAVDVIAYERENLNRPEVIEALEPLVISGAEDGLSDTSALGEMWEDEELIGA